MFTGTENDPAAGIGNRIKRRIKVVSVTSGMYEPGVTPETPGLYDPVGLLSEIETELKSADAKQTIYILLDFHDYVSLPGAQGTPVRRKMRDLVEQLKTKRSTVVFVSPNFDVPSDLSKEIAVFDVPLPDKTELKDILCARITTLHAQVAKLREIIKNPGQHDLAERNTKELAKLVPIVSHLSNQAKENEDRIVQSLMGLTATEAENTVAKCAILNDLSIKTILSEKRQIVRKAGAEYIESDENETAIGGCRNLKHWIISVQNRFSDEARAYGITPPRGVLLAGAPGTGKSLTAKVIGNLFGLPVLRLDMAGMASKFYGETGNRMNAFLKLAKALSPCIVFTDEIDKMMASGQQGNEHEESARTRGALLTSMEETEGIFWLATCNNPTNLAPELMARFPNVFHVDLPSPDERKEIFAIHLSKVGRDPKAYDLTQLADQSNGYVGREIRNAIQEALGYAFDERTAENKTPKLTEAHILKALHKIVPTSKQREKEITVIRNWSKVNAQPANEEPAAPTQTAVKDIVTDDLTGDADTTELME